MKTAVIILNFGEPEHATMEEVVPFLERIFMMNASLEDASAYERAQKRSQQLARERAPGLIEEFEKIGGSPLHEQARQEARALQSELKRRGHDIPVFIGMQFTQPSIAQAVEQARAAGAERLIGLPAYPLCGRSTTIAALEDLTRAVENTDWDVELREITGWHTHPKYTQLRADAIRRTYDRNGVSLDDPRVRLVFSAHGTPIKYIEEGSRYQEYVLDSCARIAAALGITKYDIGYQNHANRPGVEWTKPDVEEVIETVDAAAVVVDAVAFLHEQSESLAELDHDLREDAEARGLAFYRVPIPFDDPRVAEVLADLVEPLTDDAVQSSLRPCRCRERPGVWCLNR
ncbi:MAG TPA: ferrochelatase [Longimicrobiales bacterium]|nr:ferrochelatase [Longimicrobiales bacterium]